MGSGPLRPDCSNLIATNGAVALVRVVGPSLEELVRVVEQPSATHEGNPQLAGSHQPLTLWQIYGEKTHCLNQPRASWFDEALMAIAPR